MRESVLRERHPICEKSAGQHGAAHPPMRIDVVLLQPPKIEYSVMGKPVSDWTAEEAAQLNPLAFIKVKAIN